MTTLTLDLPEQMVETLAGAELTAQERAEAGQALARLGDPRSGVGLRPDGLPDNEQ